MKVSEKTGAGTSIFIRRGRVCYDYSVTERKKFEGEIQYSRAQEMIRDIVSHREETERGLEEARAMIRESEEELRQATSELALLEQKGEAGMENAGELSETQRHIDLVKRFLATEEKLIRIFQDQIKAFDQMVEELRALDEEMKNLPPHQTLEETH